MAGLCVTIGEAANSDAVKSVAAECASDLDRYEHERIDETDSLRFSEFPIQVIEQEDFTLVVEDHVYDTDGYESRVSLIDSQIQSDTDSIIVCLHQLLSIPYCTTYSKNPAN